ncbi:MAG: hypothetical protein NZ480_05455 [Bdellovibrionaceae bacterium]|nr:hypothetical protein [Pseudobdellovibrionaceae bacterium]MDW8190467.1 hypothetical protein [Pseudobdellovibrionaceae bacterium]
MYKKRSFLHVATVALFCFGLWSCSPPPWPQITEEQVRENIDQLAHMLQPFAVTVEPAHLKVRFIEVPFYTSHHTSSPSCGQFFEWSPSCDRENQLAYPTFLNRWLPYIIHYPPNQKQAGGVVLTFKKIGMSGLLFLYPSAQPRPLYIVRGGIGSRYDSFFVERPLLLTLILHQKAHVLFMGSSVNDVTLTQYDFKNSGPFVDYYHNYHLLKVFSANPFNRYFSEIHLVAISLSGLGGYLSSNFDPLEAQSPSFKKIFLLCPFLNYPLKVPDMKHFWYYQTTKFWALRRFRRSLEKLGIGLDEHPLSPIFQKLDQTQGQLTKEGQFEELLKVTQAFRQSQQNSPTEESSPSSSSNSILTENAHLLRKIWNHKAPVFVLLSKIDPIVDPHENGVLLQEKNHPMIWFEKGFHCQFYLAYPTDLISQLFQ